MMFVPQAQPSANAPKLRSKRERAPSTPSLSQQRLFNKFSHTLEVLMEFTLHTENLRVTGDIEEFVQKKLSKLGRYLPNIISVHVELEQQNSTRGPDVIIAQITLKHSRGAILRTEERVEKVDYNSVKTA